MSATCTARGVATMAKPQACARPAAAFRPAAGARAAAFSRGVSTVHALRSSGARAAPARLAAVSVRSEISYVMIKPDGVQRGLVGEIITRFERKGFTLRALKLFQTPRQVAEEHYKDLSAKPFFPKLVEYILSGPVVWEGDGVVKSARKIIGATNPLEAEPGTIRGDFAIQVGRNVVHGSDSPENGERETALWFGSEGLVAWEPAQTPWLIE